jgi:hypothetical protein
MADTRLRELLESEGRRVSLTPGASERMFDRRDRRDRRRRLVTIAEGLAISAGIIALIVVALPRGDRDATVATDPAMVAGTYRMHLTDRDPGVAELGLAGEYELRLAEDGSMVLLSPPDVDMPGPPIGFAIAGQQLTTDLLAGLGCGDTGTYGWSREADVLRLAPVDDDCAVRSTVLSTHPWAEISTPTSPYALQGEWRATFTCEAMVATVDAADVPSSSEASWREANAEEMGSPDPEDPCAGAAPLRSYTLRFAGDRLQIFDNGPGEGFDGRYLLEGNVLTIRDPRTRNIDGAYRLDVEVGEGTLTFQLLDQGASDPWFLATWQVAPFEAI